MNKWNNFPFVRYAMALISGIVLYDHQPSWWDTSLFFIGLMVAAILLQWVSRKYGYYRFSIVNGIILLGLISYTGGYLARHHSDKNNPLHYSHYEGSIQGFTGKIVSDGSRKDRYDRYQMEVNYLYSDSIFPVTGQIFLYVQGDTGRSLFEYGSIITVSSGFFPIEPPKNPAEFNYKKYLERQNIYSQAFIPHEAVRVLRVAPDNAFLAFAFRIRNSARRMMEQFIETERERAVLNALIIGIKDDLDNEIKATYSAAGAMHVLAVSGLHVGIVYYLVILILGGVRKKPYGKIVFGVVAIIIIWGYALVTGFSPSVMRASTMFSVVIAGTILGRNSNVFNSLGIAAFLLLVYDSNFVYSVGFQLSFVAVLGIVYLQPLIYRWWTPKNKILNYIWAITAVSVAAQVATFPLTAFYFHQFPTYFLISNWVVIPAAMGMLVAGLTLLITGALFPSAAMFIGLLLSKFTWLVNESLSTIGALPVPIIDWLHLDEFQVLVLYFFIVLILWALAARSFPLLAFSFSFLFLFFIWEIILQYQYSRQKRILFYEIEGHTVIDLIDGDNALLLIDTIRQEEWELLEYQINPHRLASGLPPIADSTLLFSEFEWMERIESIYFFEWNERRIVIVDSSNHPTFTRPVKADVAVINALENAADWIKADQFIIGNKANWYDQQRIKQALAQKGIRGHTLRDDGYWEVRLGEKRPRFLY